jgi:putative chitinase
MHISNLNGIIPVNVIEQLPDTMNRFQINTPLRLAHFLAQCAHESGNFKFTVENLNYSAQALMSVFRKYFPTEALASQYARQPQKIANFVYANRMGNGSPESGEGFGFRGRGYIQLTGKTNYSLFNEFVEEDIIKNPDLVATKYPLLSAGWFWDTNKLNAIADRGASEEVVTAVTRRVNGGTNGLADRIFKFNQFYRALFVQTI